MLASIERERTREQAVLAAQRASAEQERSRRAREELKRARESEIQSARRVAGLCIHCGRRLGALTRLLKVACHRACRSFTE